ncbi:MAG: hypothetical protein KDC46_03835, partial [Thermoleophilia bacterium]|nr:hypothetical protein [Thermoleophilia bacterium]
MHRYHDEQFAGIEFGSRFTQRHRMMIDGGGGSTTKTTTKPAEPTDTDKVREAVKDGTVSSGEKTVFEKPETIEIVKSEEERLRTAITDATTSKDPDAPRPSRGAAPTTEHDARVTELKDNKEHGSLEALDEQIKRYEADGETAAANSVKQERDARAADEQKVAGVIENRESLAGTLEAEKQQIQASTDPRAGDGSYSELRAEADKWITQFNDNGGQFYGGDDWFGDDWDEHAIDFDQLVDRLGDKQVPTGSRANGATRNANEGLIDDFVNSQGEYDGDLRGKSESEAFDYINSHYDAEMRDKVRNRYVAAKHLKDIVEQYDAAKGSYEGGADRISKIDAEIENLNADNDSDREALSQETLDALARNNVRTDGIISTPSTPSNDHYDGAGKHSPATPSSTDNTDGADGSGSTDSSGSTENT